MATFLARKTESHVAREMYALIERLYPICRSITGNGVRQTLAEIIKHIPLTIHEVASGTKVLDWTVPLEWNIRHAYVKDSAGKKVIDFSRSNLHVLNYSTPIKTSMSLGELKKHLFTLPEQPNAIPYRTTYYEENWGFCLAHKDLLKLKDDIYEVVIDSSLTKGSLTYGEYFIKGERKEEILISTHICHPTLANDNLTGLAIAVALANHLAGAKPLYSYRFIFIPGTIGSITWLAGNEKKLKRIASGLVLTGLGDAGSIHYKKSRRADAPIDKAMKYIISQQGKGQVMDFFPYGYDERQFCSPGFNLPFGCLMRTPFGQYPEYHTSADNLSFIKSASLQDSLQTCLAALLLLEQNGVYRNTHPKGEPQLGKRGIYKAMNNDNKTEQMALLWVLNLSDGTYSLLDIAKRSGIPFEQVRTAADILLQHKLLKFIAYA